MQNDGFSRWPITVPEYHHRHETPNRLMGQNQILPAQSCFPNPKLDTRGDEDYWLAAEEDIRGYKIDWNGSQIHTEEGWEGNKYGTIAWVHFDTKLVLATVYVDQWFYKHVPRHFDEAFE